jgi:cytosine/adenosine deaminase-related metal-dependent hydrolase
LLRSPGVWPEAVIAFPGLINSHDHLEFNCYPPTGTPPYDDFLGWCKDVQADPGLAAITAIDPAIRRQFGVLKNILWGVTAVADHGGKKQFGELPIRVLTKYTDLHSPELGEKASWLNGLGPVVLHLAEGVTPQTRLRALAFLARNRLRRPVAAVHAVSLLGADFAQFQALIWCPASNFYLFGKTADAAAAIGQTRLLFGTDSTLSAPLTLWDHLRQVRSQIGDLALFKALTEAPSAFWRLQHRDDFVIAKRKASASWDSFFALTPDDILLVVMRGQAVLVDEQLRDLLPIPADFTPLRWRHCCKYVRMSVSLLLSGIGNQRLMDEVIARFVGQ